VAISAGKTWRKLGKTIKAQRKEIAYALDESPSLIPKMNESRWLDMVWHAPLQKRSLRPAWIVFPRIALGPFLKKSCAKVGCLRSKAFRAGDLLHAGRTD